LARADRRATVQFYRLSVSKRALGGPYVAGSRLCRLIGRCRQWPWDTS